MQKAHDAHRGSMLKPFKDDILMVSLNLLTKDLIFLKKDDAFAQDVGKTNKKQNNRSNHTRHKI